MSVWHRIVRFVVLVIIGYVAAGGLVTATSAGRWQTALGLLADERVTVVWAVAGVLVTAILFAWTGMRVPRREKYLCFDNEGGRVSISTAAIEEYLMKIAGDFPSIVKFKPKVIPLRDQIDVVAELRVKAGPQIHEICRVLQQRIRENLATGLGISQVRNVEVRVREISSEHLPE